MTVAVRLDLSEENLRSLLDEGIESELLDYKRMCNLSEPHELIELVKDIAAMQIEGGYILVGADDHGQLIGTLETRLLKPFQQASLRAKVLPYLGEPLILHARTHTIDGKHAVLIYVGQHPDGFCVVAKNGHGRDGKLVFRVGDVFARHGSASERWSQHDIAKIRQRIVERERERWLREATLRFADQLPHEGVAQIATAPVGALQWHLDGDTFRAVVIEQIRRNDLIPLKLLLAEVQGELRQLPRTTDSQEFVLLVLDRLSCLAALFLQLEDEELFRRVVDAFVGIYNLGFDTHGAPRSGFAMPLPTFWFEVIQRIVAIGALAQRLENWSAVRYLADRRGRGNDFDHYATWYRHALTQAARVNLLKVQLDGRQTERSLLGFGHLQIERLACLRPDIEPDEMLTLDSLCSFDVLACLIGIDIAGRPISAAYYPSFARYFSLRSSPVIRRLLDDPDVRAAVFRGTDEQLAAALAEIARVAWNEGFNWNGWMGYNDDRINGFLEQHNYHHHG